MVAQILVWRPNWCQWTIECKTQASISSRLPNRVICECECRILLSHPHVQRHDDLMPELSPLSSELEFSARKVGPNVYTFQCQSGVQQFALGVWTALYLWYTGWAHVPKIRCKSLASNCFFLILIVHTSGIHPYALNRSWMFPGCSLYWDRGVHGCTQVTVMLP